MDDSSNIVESNNTDGFLSFDESGGKQNGGPCLDAFRVLDWRVFPTQNRFQRGDDEITVLPKSMDVFMTLVAADGDTVSKGELVEKAWGGVIVADDSVHRAISKLRKALSPDIRLNDLIITVPRRGYRLNTALLTTAVDSNFAVANETTSSDKRLFPSAIAVPTLLVAAVLILVVVAFSINRDAVPKPDIFYRVIPVTSLVGQERGATFSPTSDEIVFAWSGENGDQWDLYRLSIGDWEPHALTDDAILEYSPAWSPSGNDVAYVHLTANSCEITTLSLETKVRTPLRSCDVGGDVDLAWSPVGDVLYYTDRVGEDGPIAVYALLLLEGVSRQVTFPPTDYWGDSLPALSADGASLAFARTRDIGVTDIYAVDLASSEERRITHDRLKIHGLAWSGRSEVTFSSNRGGGFGLWTVNTKSGEPQTLPGAGSNADSVAISRDGSRLIFESEKTHANLWRVALNADDPELTKALSASTEWDWHPAVSPTKDELAFVSDRSGTPELWLADLSGEKPRRLTDFGGPYLMSPRWAPDGEAIAFAAPRNGNFDIYVFDISASTMDRLTSHPSSDRTATFDPAGDYIYFSSSRTGRWEIWRQQARSGAAEHVTTDGGFRPLISEDGSFLYFTKREEPGVWRRSLNRENATSEKIIDDLLPIDWSNWFLHGGQVYYVIRNERFDASLAAHDTNTGESLILRSLPQMKHHSGLALASDDSVVYSRQENVETDLVMLEAVDGRSAPRSQLSMKRLPTSVTVDFASAGRPSLR